MSFLYQLLEPAGIAGIVTGVLLASAPVILGFIAFQRLKVRLKQRHQQLAGTYRRNQAIVEASGEGVLELDPVLDRKSVV